MKQTSSRYQLPRKREFSLVCRASRYSSAMVTFARDMTGLEDNQVLSINHQLMRDSHNVSLTDMDTQWQESIQEAINDYNAGRTYVSSTSANPLPRLEQALSERSDTSRIYAGRRLIQACREADRAQEDYLTRYARDMGISQEAARQRFNTEFAVASEHSVLNASPRFVSMFTSNPDNTGISVDRRTMYALENMETTRLSQLHATREVATNRTLELEVEGRENGAAEFRWSDDSHHVEIDFLDPHDGLRTELYRGDAELIRTLERQAQNSSGSDESIEEIVHALRSNIDYHYSSHQEASQSRWRYRCPSCGQFANSAHHCPVIGAPTSIEADIAYLAGLQVSGTGEIQESHTTHARNTTRYLMEDGTARMPGVGLIRANARNHDITEVEISAEIGGMSNQRGIVQVHYSGYGNGYEVLPAINPGDQGDRRLRCSCPEYADRYTCHHIAILESNLRDIINREDASTLESVNAVVSNVTEDISNDRQASEASAQADVDGWKEPAQPLVDNFELFQQEYSVVREKRKRWMEDPENNEFPIAYKKENAFGGLSTRENGRGFGIEIEFAFPEDMDSGEAHEARNRIAEELREAGLISNASVRHYGASHGWVRDNHVRGWSIEEDFSAGGRDGQVPAEIVSPIMYDEPETWENIEKICSIVKRNGGFASRGSGQHVHVSTGDYNHRVVNHNRLLSMIAENEDLLYRLSVDPKRGRHRGFGYCTPNRAASAPYSRITHVRNDQSGHNLGVNFQSVSGRDSDHAEFRMFDSSLEPAVIQAQIGVSLSMTAAAKRDVISNVPQDNISPLGTRLEANPRRNALSGEEWREQTLPIRSFIDKYVPTHGKNLEDSSFAKQLIGLFAITK
jgi:hypothetical protein